MIESLAIGLAACAGLILGAIFFGGLWWTVRKGLVAKQPALWFLGSFLIRTGFVLFGFYFAGGGQWPRLLSCLLGFLVARFVVMCLTRPSTEMRLPEVQEARHAT
jgi:F1F0 ATPase subunit 2